MVARHKRRPPLTMTKTLGGLEPTTPYDAERLAEYGFGQKLEVTIWQCRSEPQNKLYWSILHFCVHNSENKYGSAEDLHKALKVALGYTRKIKMLLPSKRAEKVIIVRKVLERCDGMIRRVVGPKHNWLLARIAEAIETVKEFETDCVELTIEGSTAYDAMDQAQFKIYFDRAMEQLRLAGYPVDEYLAESEKMLAPTRPDTQPYQKDDNLNGIQRGQAATESVAGESVPNW